MYCYTFITSLIYIYICICICLFIVIYSDVYIYVYIFICTYINMKVTLMIYKTHDGMTGIQTNSYAYIQFGSRQAGNSLARSIFPCVSERPIKVALLKWPSAASTLVVRSRRSSQKNRSRKLKKPSTYLILMVQKQKNTNMESQKTGSVIDIYMYVYIYIYK